MTATATVCFDAGAGFVSFLAGALAAGTVDGASFFRGGVVGRASATRTEAGAARPTLDPDLASVGEAFSVRFGSVFLAAATDFLAGSGADLTAFDAWAFGALWTTGLGESVSTMRAVRLPLTSRWANAAEEVLVEDLTATGCLLAFLSLFGDKVCDEVLAPRVGLALVAGDFGVDMRCNEGFVVRMTCEFPLQARGRFPTAFGASCLNLEVEILNYRLRHKTKFTALKSLCRFSN